MNLTKFEYPMFSTTDREKEILRMVEMYIVDHHNWLGICSILFNIQGRLITCIEYRELKYKIACAIGTGAYLEDTCRGITGLNNDTHKLMRRIWITKLLNHKGDQP